MKKSGDCCSVGNEKFTQILPWITRISSSGIPADLNVKSSTTSTINIETMLTTMLSRAKDFLKS